MLTSSIQQINTLFYILSNKAYIILLSYLTNRNRMCDIFVHHVAKQLTLKDLKYYLNHNGFDTDRMRIDITSNKEVTYKSFRIIASGDLRKSLLDSE